MKTSETKKSNSHLETENHDDLLKGWAAADLREAWKAGLEGEPLLVQSAEEHRRFFARKED